MTTGVPITADVEYFCAAVCWTIHSGRGAVPPNFRVLAVLRALGALDAMENGQRAPVVEELLLAHDLVTRGDDGKLVLTAKGVGLAVHHGLEQLGGDPPEED